MKMVMEKRRWNIVQCSGLVPASKTTLYVCIPFKTQMWFGALNVRRRVLNLPTSRSSARSSTPSPPRSNVPSSSNLQGHLKFRDRRRNSCIGEVCSECSLSLFMLHIMSQIMFHIYTANVTYV